MAAGREREQTTIRTIRLTLRLPDELDRMIRKEAIRRGTNINQTMLHILSNYFKSQK
ncbi:MAG: hypothetical protein OSJ62_07460 [Lachnospiraceae bacterium]|nr:hypothetical protein [Lachnospiraceae bacterium]